MSNSTRRRQDILAGLPSVTVIHDYARFPHFFFVVHSSSPLVFYRTNNIILHPFINMTTPSAWTEATTSRNHRNNHHNRDSSNNDEEPHDDHHSWRRDENPATEEGGGGVIPQRKKLQVRSFLSWDLYM
jgi:hypothetical protein